MIPKNRRFPAKTGGLESLQMESIVHKSKNCSVERHNLSPCRKVKNVVTTVDT